MNLDVGVSRPLRIQAAGLTYHVTSRGNSKMTIFVDDEDRETFMALLVRMSERSEVPIHTYCQMTNHYHLVCRTERPNISTAIHDLNGGYASYFNRRHRRSGHVFQGRFNAQVIEEEGYLREACRYVALNPVRAGLVARPELWRWSAHRALAGIDPEPRLLSTSFLRREFLEQDLRFARARYVEFVDAAIQNADGCASTFDGDLRVVGSTEFVAGFERCLMAASKDVPRRERFLARPSLETLLAGVPGRAELDRRMLNAHVRYGYTLREIATLIGVSIAAVSVRIGEARKSSLQPT